jgi:hypothetical protein
MIEKLSKTIEILKTKNVDLFDEIAIKQTIILRLLSELGWNIFDRDEVYPEFSLEDKRVDYALRHKNREKVFLEVKRPEENLEKHQEQLLNYSFKQGVNLAILTNGITWWFYLPLKEGNWSNRKFYTIDFKNQSETEIAERFITYLLKENVLTDESIRAAEETLKSKNREIEIENSLPLVWKTLLNKPTTEFIQLLADETEKQCGYRPTDKYVIKFLNNIGETNIYSQELNNFYNKIITKNDINLNHRAGNTKLKVTFQNGEVINENNAIDTFIKTIQKFGIDRVKTLPIINGVPLISDTAINKGEKKTYKKISNSKYFINVNHGTPKKKQYLEKIAYLLKENIKVEIV